MRLLLWLLAHPMTCLAMRRLSVSTHRALAKSFPENPLPPEMQERMASGQLWTALILSGYYVEGAGQPKLDLNPVTAHIGSPFVDSQPGWESSPTFMLKFGNGQLGDSDTRTVSYLWKGTDKTIYVVFAPAEDFKHMAKIWWQSGKEHSTEDGIYMHGYIKRKMHDMWEAGLGKSLKNFATSPEYQDWTFAFTGISLGSSMAQLAAYRFARSLPAWAQGTGQTIMPDYFLVAWNGFMWTDPAGAEAVDRALGEKMLIIVNSHRDSKTLSRSWDSPSGLAFGQGFVNMPVVRLIDSGCNRPRADQAEGDENLCGQFLSCRLEDHCPGDANWYAPKFRHDMNLLHSAKNVMLAMKKATQVADREARRTFVSGIAGSASCLEGSIEIKTAAACKRFGDSSGPGYESYCEKEEGAPDYCASRPLHCWQDEVSGYTMYKGFGENVAYVNSKKICMS